MGAFIGLHGKKTLILKTGFGFGPDLTIISSSKLNMMLNIYI
jgi:hypothetical protein